MNTRDHDEWVILTGEELAVTGEEHAAWIAAALVYSRTHFQGRTVVNLATGQPIAFGRRGLNKTLNHGAQRAHVCSVPALPALLVRAVLVHTAPNHDPAEARNIPWVHTLHGRLLLAAVPYRVRLIVKATNVGWRFYDHDLTRL